MEKHDNYYTVVRLLFKFQRYSTRCRRCVQLGTQLGMGAMTLGLFINKTQLEETSKPAWTYLVRI